MQSSTQLIHMKVKYENDSHWFLTAMYGSPHFSKWQELWRELRDIHEGISDPWAITRDFNAIMCDSER